MIRVCVCARVHTHMHRMHRDAVDDNLGRLNYLPLA